MSITKSHDIFERFMNESCGSSLTCEQFMKVFFHLLTFGYSTCMMNSRSKFNQYLFSLSFLYLTRKGERLMPFAFLLFPAARDFILFPAAFGGRRRCRCPAPCGTLPLCGGPRKCPPRSAERKGPDR